MSQQKANIVQPHEHDVLSGRGNYVNYHAGNEFFRSLVRKHKVAYVACPKPQKGKFSKMIVDEIRARNPPGRFLKHDPKTKLWYDIGEKKSLDKTRQALREGAPVIMKELHGEDDDDSGSESPSASTTPQQDSTPKVSSTFSPSIGNNTSLVGGFLSNDVQQLSFDNFNNINTGAIQNSLSPGHNQLLQAQLSSADPIQQPQQLGSNSLQRTIMSHNSMPYSGLVMFQQQQAQQQQQQQQNQFRSVNRNKSAPTTGLNLQLFTSNMQNNAQVGTPSFADFQQKMTSLTNQQVPPFQDPSLEPTPIGPSSSTASPPLPNTVTSSGTSTATAKKNYSDGLYYAGEQKQLAPLPPRVPLRGMSRRGLKRDESESSLHIESIFGGNKSSLLDCSDHRKQNGSSFGHSNMSLSSLDEDYPKKTSTASPIVSLEAVKDPDSLGPIFSTSMRFSERRPGSKRPQRMGSGDFSDSAQNVMQMSVATLNDQFNESGYGDSIVNMSESQAQMSFSNVFEDSDKEIFVNQTR